jgi:putative nucleotidyltransferase with HDIG domain
MLKVFPDSFYDNAFGTVGIPIRDSVDKKPETIYEVTTYRTEASYSDNRRPDEVNWGKKLEEDLIRRDFTINAIAYDGEKIIDPLDGQKDLKEKTVRAVGDPEKRFQEDALRLMRAVRIATQLGFSIEEKTFEAVRKNSNLIKNIATERIRDELLKILSSDFAADGILILKNSGLLDYILPELELCFGIGQKSPKRHHILDVGTHLVESLRFCPSKDPIVRFATLVHDIGKPQTRKEIDGVITFYNHEIVGAGIVKKILDRLHFSKKDREKIYRLVRFHQFTVDERQTDSAVRRILRNVGIENMNDMLDLRTGDRLGGGAAETSWRLELFKKRLIEVQIIPFSVQDLKINGNDVMKILNTKPGPIIGKTLNDIFLKVESGQTKNEREELLEELKKYTS